MAKFTGLAPSSAPVTSVGLAGPPHHLALSGGPYDMFARLPEAARAIVAHIEEQIEDLAGIVAAAQDRWEEAFAAKQDAEQQYRQLTDPYASLSYRGERPLDSNGPTAAAARQKVERAGIKLAQATLRRDAASHRLNSARHRLDRIREWLGRVPENMAIEPHTAKPYKLPKGETIVEAVERVRNERAQFVADLRATQTAPIPAAQAKRRARAQVEQLAERGAPDCYQLIEHGGDIRWPRDDPRFALHAFAVDRDGTQAMVQGFAAPSGEHTNTLALLAWLHKDALIKAIEAEIDRSADDKHALDDQQRASRVADLQARILECERAEVSFIEQAGSDIQHRDDVDPRALLKLSGDLPAPKFAG